MKEKTIKHFDEGKTMKQVINLKQSNNIEGERKVDISLGYLAKSSSKPEYRTDANNLFAKIDFIKKFQQATDTDKIPLRIYGISEDQKTTNILVNHFIDKGVSKNTGKEYAFEKMRFSYKNEKNEEKNIYAIKLNNGNIQFDSRTKDLDKIEFNTLFAKSLSVHLNITDRDKIKENYPKLDAVINVVERANLGFMDDPSKQMAGVELNKVVDNGWQIEKVTPVKDQQELKNFMEIKNNYIDKDVANKNKELKSQDIDR